MPSFLFSMEIEMRKTIKEKVKRGSMDVMINYKKLGSYEWNHLDMEKIKSFVAEIQSSVNGEVRFNAMDFLKSSFTKEQIPDEKLKEDILKVLDQALDGLLISREQEGERLLLIMQENRERFENSFFKIKPLTKTYKKLVEDKLKKQFAEFKEQLDINTSRFLQEVVYYLDKMDITEELDRITGHLKRVDDLFKRGGEIGRELDFILQELNRETNTIGAKSADKDISNIVIDMKIELEKIREQSLNLE
ncbi:MAG: DUF1732 domain-containing protein, partial [Halobacteriovoraceae bacterium]|nr:DUF1732 domain-containing protein [Halobacteriovoraceae bacterium]